MEKMTTYDEDLSENQFYQTFQQAYVDLFSQCVCEKWLICVPRRDSLPKHAFTLEDFTHHILKPLHTSVEMKTRRISSDGESFGNTTSYSNSFQNLSTSMTSMGSSITNLSTSPAASSSTSENGLGPNRKWNFRTLADVKLEYTDGKLFFNVESPRNFNAVLNNFSTGHPRSISVLFEETYYTSDKQKYKVLCIASPLNSKVEDLNTTGEEDDEKFLENGSVKTFLWNLTSLRDCIDFLWLNGKARALENFDAHIKLFLHNHQTLDDLPLAVQRDLVFDLYKKCLSFAVKSAVAVSSPRNNNNNNTGPSPEINSEILRSNTFSPNDTMQSHVMQNFKLATETYVLSGLYRQLINAVTSAVSFEDANLNKVTRNLAEIQPQDLDINSNYWENLTRARNELGRLNLHASPLSKVNCLKKAMGYLRQGNDESESRDFENSGTMSTDDLLPIWVYLIVKTPLGNWMAQLQFMRLFRFSANRTPDNENSFLIVTLEASLTHLSSGKISGLPESETDVGMTCEAGDMFLRNLSLLSKDGTVSPLAEIFNVIRQGSFFKLEEMVNAHDTRRNHLNCSLKDGLNLPKLCHPLCHCEDCQVLTKTDSEVKSIFQLSNEDGISLLHVACVYGRPKIVDFLINSGAPHDTVDNQRRTPLHYASRFGNQNALLLILHSGSELAPLDNEKNTPLHLAAMNGHETCVKALIYYAEHSRLSVGLSERNVKGDTPLHFAARFGFQGIVQILVEIGASITLANNKQSTPMDCAHDIRISRILQRSLRRRSLIHTNHGDFVNIDVIKKDETSRVVMLISEPNQAAWDPEPISPRSSTNVSISGRRRSSSISTTQSQPQDTNISGRVKRDTSSNSNISHNNYGTKLVGNNYRKINYSGLIQDSQTRVNGTNAETIDITDIDTDFYVPNILSKSCSEPEHLRKFSVENLETSPSVLASKAVFGLKRKRDAKERGLRKLFTAITVGDVPLALFYLGISAEELERVDDIIPGDLVESVSCHPLCSCNRCCAKNSGLDFSINVRNHSGLSPLHLAVQYNIHSLVKILLKYKADSKLCSLRENKTAIQFAKENYHYDIATTLEEWEAATGSDFII